jgi:hypothetical protein
MVFYQIFILSLYGNCKRLREFEEIEISRQSYCIEETVNNKEKTLKYIFLDFVQEFGLCLTVCE